MIYLPLRPLTECSLRSRLSARRPEPPHPAERCRSIMSACQKHEKNSHVTSQHKETWVACNKLKKVRNILFCLFPSVCVAPWRECYPFVGIDRRFALSCTVACRYCKCSVFRRQRHLFPLAGGREIPSSIALSVKLSTCL